MVKITEEARQAFLRDSEPKELEISAVDSELDNINYYFGRFGIIEDENDPTQDYMNTSIVVNPGDSYKFECNNVHALNYDLASVTDLSLAGRRKYICVSVEMAFYWALVLQLPATIRLALVYNVHTQSGYTSYVSYKWYNTSGLIKSYDTDYGYARVYITIPCRQNNGTVSSLFYLAIDNASDENIAIQCNIKYRRFMVNIGDDESHLPIDYVFNYDENQINYWQNPISLSNADLISESFSLSESLCSEENIKFGLCEAAHCEFTVAEKFYSYKDRRIKPIIKMSSDSEATVRNIVQQINFYNYFDPRPGEIKHSDWGSCSFLSSLSTGTPADSINNNYFSYGTFIKFRFECSVEYYDEQGNVAENFPYKVLFVPIGDFSTDSSSTFHGSKYWSDNIPFTIMQNDLKLSSDLITGFTTVNLWLPIKFGDYYYEHYGLIENVKDVINLYGILMQFFDENNHRYSSSAGRVGFRTNIKNMQICLVDSLDQELPTYDPNDCVEYYGKTVSQYINENLPQVPLGIFTIQDVEKNYVRDSVKFRLTAYDDLTLLEQNAADWYTQYMFGVNFDSYSSHYGFQFARQIFSTYWNYITGIGLDRRLDYEETVLFDQAVDTSTLSNYVSWSDSQTVNPYNTLYYGYIDQDISSLSSNIFVVDVDIKDDIVAFQTLTYYSSYRNHKDALGRGIIDNGAVLIQETTSDSSTHCYCVNNGDYFMVSKTCTALRVYVPYRLRSTGGSNYDDIIGKVKLSSVNLNIDLENGWIRLLYYNWSSKEIFSCDSSITGRDVIHSLIEPCGCFFRMNRFTGKPEFIYCTKAGLYPRDDLYPADDLYPRLGTNDVITMDKYEEFRQQDYAVQKYGKIQIRKNTNSNEAKSICQWEYVGDPNCINTYIFDDNIFYCHPDMEYEYGSMEDVSDMLANMYMRISNMDYVPNVTKCKGMPWIECGDRIGVLTKTGGAESFVFKRTLKGIQSLHDTFESEGDEYIEAIKDYDYKIWEG